MREWRKTEKPSQLTASPYHFLLLAFVVLSISGCNGDYETSLPNGYKLFRTNSSTKVILAPTGKQHPSHCAPGLAVAAKVNGMAIVGKWVVGVVVTSPTSEVVNCEAPGYFILNTETGEVWLRLTEAKWRARLKTEGINENLNLSRP